MRLLEICKMEHIHRLFVLYMYVCMSVWIDIRVCELS